MPLFNQIPWEQHLLVKHMDPVSKVKTLFDRFPPEQIWHEYQLQQLLVVFYFGVARMLISKHFTYLCNDRFYLWGVEPSVFEEWLLRRWREKSWTYVLDRLIRFLLHDHRKERQISYNETYVVWDYLTLKFRLCTRNLKFCLVRVLNFLSFALEYIHRKTMRGIVYFLGELPCRNYSAFCRDQIIHAPVDRLPCGSEYLWYPRLWCFVWVGGDRPCTRQACLS